MSIDWDKVIRELSKPNGWHKGTYGEWSAPDASVCLLGAIMRVNDDELESACDVITPIIRANYPERTIGKVGPVPNFNDHPETTLADVIAVCEKARANE